MPRTYFIRRDTVTDPAKVAAFDDWDPTEHLSEADKSFGADKASLDWSETDPAASALRDPR